jgi:hypothetical protein
MTLHVQISLTLEEAYMTAGTIAAVAEGLKNAIEENSAELQEEYERISNLFEKFAGQIPKQEDYPMFQE